MKQPKHFQAQHVRLDLTETRVLSAAVQCGCRAIAVCVDGVYTNKYTHTHRLVATHTIHCGKTTQTTHNTRNSYTCTKKNAARRFRSASFVCVLDARIDIISVPDLTANRAGSIRDPDCAPC